MVTIEAAADHRRGKGAVDADALRYLLTKGRAAIKPEELGFVRSDPRGLKSPGLSQAHMDELLGEDPETRRSPGTYGRLERGILDNPSPQYLLGVARILRFSTQEWVSLFSFARGEFPSIRLCEDAEIAVSDPWREGADDLTSIEFITDFTGNVLACNPNFGELFPDQRVPVNIFYNMLFAGHSRDVLLPDWETVWGPPTVAALRAARAQHRHNALLRTLVKQAHTDPRTRGLLATIPVASTENPAHDERPLVHPRLGRGWVRVSEPLSSEGGHVSHHSWIFRTPEQPRIQPALLRLGDERDPAGFLPTPTGGRRTRPAGLTTFITTGRSSGPYDR
jgi:hypothetical protein